MPAQKKITKNIQLKLQFKGNFLRWLKLSLCIFCLLWLSCACLFLLRVDKEMRQLHLRRENTFIFNIPLFNKLEYAKDASYDTYLLKNKTFVTLSNNIDWMVISNARKMARNITSDTETVKRNDSIQKSTHKGAPPFEDTFINLQDNFDFFQKNFTIQDSFLKSWSQQKTVQCSGKFEGYANKFVRWINITLDSTKSSGSLGGEDVSQVLKQRESKEFLNPSKGFFQADCKMRPKYTFSKYLNTRGHLPNWLNVVKLPYPFEKRVKTKVLFNFTIAIQRYEYANIYHSMNDIFNVFLLHIFFHKDPKDSIILFADGHPKGHIDPLWENLFGKIIRVRHLKEKVKFKEMVWPMLEKFSPLNLFDLKQVSYINHFRTFVLGKYGRVPRPSPNCNNLHVLFLWRHDYLSHPRNPKGKLMRKIHNEDELFNVTVSSFPTINFRAVDLSSLLMKEQIKLISETDIIIGMHGAGLMLELFLPPKGGVIELLPKKLNGFSKKQYDLFKIITDRIPLNYLRWQNQDQTNEVTDGYTYIPPKVVVFLLKQLLHRVCPTQ